MSVSIRLLEPGLSLGIGVDMVLSSATVWTGKMREPVGRAAMFRAD